MSEHLVFTAVEEKYSSYIIYLELLCNCRYSKSQVFIPE